ncbi:MAG: hypothetical protein P8M02_00080 [Flavobacteriaceae bacterium]|nr:hypothetical protein [Flavobacteriaceae bacterium]MDG2385797.1 hypothetical protein [Flavobacteriaceae bacterium]
MPKNDPNPKIIGYRKKSQSPSLIVISAQYAFESANPKRKSYHDLRCNLAAKAFAPIAVSKMNSPIK